MGAVGEGVAIAPICRIGDIRIAGRADGSVGQVQGGLTGAWVQRGFRSLQSVLESRADQPICVSVASLHADHRPWLDRECAWRQQILGSCSPASQSTIRLPPSSVSICTKACASATTSPMSAASWP